MAFSSVAATNSGNTGGSTATIHACNLPSGIASGDLLLLFFTLREAVESSTTLPAGWTRLYQTDRGSCHADAAYRIADGGEGATVNVVSDNAGRSAHLTYRTASWHGTTVPEVSVPATGSSSSPNPASLSPSWGAEDTLWIATAHCDERAVTGYPTNYTNGFQTNFEDFSPSVGSARRELNATSDDPTAFTLSASRAWVSSLVAVRPAVAGGGGVADLTITLSAFGASDNATLAVFGAAVGTVALEAGYAQGAAQSAEYNILHTAFRSDNDTTPTGTINPAGGKLLGIAVELKASSPAGTKPVAPSAPVITEVAYNTLDLSCTDNASNEDGFKWYLSKNGGDFAEITGSPTAANVVTLRYTDATPGVGGNVYRLRVVAYNAFGDSDPTESNQTVTTTVTGDPVETTAAFPTGTFPTTTGFPTAAFPTSSKFPS